MVVINVSMSDEMYGLLGKMQTEFGLGLSKTLTRMMKLSWAHWSGCLEEGKKDAE